MTAGWPWRLLDIEPTPDRRAIRSAYSAKLKAIDVDADKDGFIALREAYDQALALAPHLATVDEENGAAPAPEELPAAAETLATEPEREGAGQDVGALLERWRDAGPEDDVPPHRIAADARWQEQGADLPEPPAPLPPPQPWREAEVAAAHAAAEALQGLLYRLGDPEDPLYETDQTATLFAHMQTVFADPDAETVDGFAAAERWFERLLMGTAPASDPLLRPVSEHFGWEAREGSIEQGPMATALMRRRRGLEFYDAVRQPGHPLHGAWQELTTPANERSRRGIVWKQNIQKLLAIVRNEHPMLEGCFDSYRVSLWEQGGARFPVRWVVFGIWVLVTLARCASSMPEPPRQTSTMSMPWETPLQNPAADIDPMLQRLAGEGVSFAALTKANPALTAALLDKWREGKAEKITLATFNGTLHHELNQWFLNGVYQTPELLRDFQQIRLEQAETLKDDPETCNRFLLGAIPYPTTTKPLPEAMQARQKALYARALLAAKSADYRLAEQAKIPPAVGAKALRLSGLTVERFNMVIKREGATDAEGCTVRRILLRTALERNKPDVVPLLQML
ncbi:hypothetical protein [Sphingomonas azotifigens]|uniref:hypothetical protein n=1 Tax=Sphingomonas azotifigens TaxID=330920 RepID=UPI000A03650A|nr:hypothetical protein [Sphingomonas azotifigens]